MWRYFVSVHMEGSSKALGSFFIINSADLRFLEESLWNIFPLLDNLMGFLKS